MDPRHAWYSRPPTPSYPAAPPPPPPPPYPAAPPPPLNPCPICSTPHFPFCPPPYPSPPQTPFQPHFRYHPPPPPPPPQHPPPLPPPPPPPHDPYHHGPPIIPPPPWNPIVNPNSNNNNNYNNSNYAYPGVKRLRVEESGVSNDDERRLKLIREHGGSSGRLSNIIDGFELNHCTSFNRREDSVYDQDDSYNMPKRYRVVNDSNGYGDSINRFGLGNNSKCDDSFGRQQHGMEMKSGYYGSPYRNERDGVNRLHNQSSEVFHGRQFSASPSPPVPPPRAVEISRSRLPDVIVSTSLPEANQFSSTYLPGVQTIHHALQKTYPRESEQLSSQSVTSDDKKIVDASLLLKHPHRTTRPDHIVVILRGLPGSGKSYLAKMFRDLEVENGGRAPRIHTMDDYFMMEVEKIEESEASKSSSSVRGRKPATKIVMEYCYEPEMEEAYRSSMLKAFKKTLDEGVYSFVIVDDRNLRVADFVQFWATAKRSGYEVYLLEAAYKDPVGCAARNIHGFTQDDIRKMADQWEEAPSMYLQLDIRSLLHGDKLLDSEIQEVDMDTGEGDYTCVPSFSDGSNAGRVGAHSTSNGPPGDDKSQDTTGPPCPKEDEAKELGKSKWSNDLDDDDDAPRTHARERNLNTLPGLNQSYRKKGKSVCWGDQVVNTGFSIGAAKVAYTSSLVIGPGAGYNLNTNPLAEADKMASKQHTGKMQNVLREQLLAEHESFKAVFDKRRQRIGGFDMDEE